MNSTSSWFPRTLKTSARYHLPSENFARTGEPKTANSRKQQINYIIYIGNQFQGKIKSEMLQYCQRQLSIIRDALDYARNSHWTYINAHTYQRLIFPHRNTTASVLAMVTRYPQAHSTHTLTHPVNCEWNETYCALRSADRPTVVEQGHLVYRKSVHYVTREPKQFFC